MKTWIAFAALVLPGAAFATGERIVVLSPSGAPGVQAQLTETLCLSEDCVAPEKVLSAGKLDWGKVAREHVASVVTGHGQVAKGKAQLEMTVLGASGKPRLVRRAPLGETNKLAVGDLVTLSASALGVIDDPKAKDLKPEEHRPAKALAHKGHGKSGSRKVATRPHSGHVRG